MNKKKNFHCNFGFLTQIKMTNIDISKTNLCFRPNLNANFFHYLGRLSGQNDSVGVMVNCCGG